jgi:hypothetical protein
MTRWRSSAVVAAACLLLNASLSFENYWPTPAMLWRGEVSVEFGAALLALAVASHRFGPPSRATLRWLGWIWGALVLGRYADVTAPALYGRDINLYWDLRFIPDVAAMVLPLTPVWLILGSVAAAVAVLVLLYVLLRWALGCVARAMADARDRRALGTLGLLVSLLFAGQRVGARMPDLFSTPVVEVYVRQARLVVEALSGSTSLPASPLMESDLSLVKGADVFLFFIESYGAVSWERPSFAAPLTASRARFEDAIHSTRRQVVSAFVESPTFGGSSWLAHLSLMSGIEVRGADTNALLMTQKRDSLVAAFARRGYRTVALMPGLKQVWPEGAFYGFDDIYNGERLNYSGPEFGWFAIPDQVSIATLDAREVDREPRAPLFVFFPTISTHFPFSPTPPYQADWRKVLTGEPYDEPQLTQAYSKEPDWVDFGPGYVDAMIYDFESLEGYLRARPDRDFVMILLGDHQPPAAVSGEHAPWDVPVHVIASRPAVLDRLLASGFSAGLTPRRPAIGRMHQLLPTLLHAFGQVEGARGK